MGGNKPFFKKVIAFGGSFALIASLGGGVSIALAAVTLSGTSITGDSLFNSFVGATSTTWDLGSGSTLSLQTTNGGPITTGNGLFTVGGAFTVNGAFTAGGPKIALTNLATSTAGNIIVTNGLNVPAYVTMSGDGTLSNAGALTFATSGVTAASYGSGTVVPVITVDAKGRLTSVTTSSVTVATLAASSLTGQVAVANGGTGASALTLNAVLLGNGTSSVSFTTVPTAGQILLGSASNVPTFTSLGGDIASVSATGSVALATTGVTAASYGSGTVVPVITVDAKGRLTSVTTSSVTVASVATSSVTGVFTLTNGGLGVTSIAANGVVFGNGTSSPLVTAAPTSGQILLGNASGVPIFATFAGDIASVSATGSVALAASNGNLTTLSAISSIDRSGTMTIGNTNATTITVGRSGQTVSFPGSVSSTAITSTGSLTAGTSTINGSLQINAGAIILKHLSATSSVTFGVVASSTCATQTMTVTGANAGDNVYAAPTPVAGGIETQNVSWSVYASSTNLIAIKACNPTTANTASIAAEVWRADVWQH